MCNCKDNTGYIIFDPSVQEDEPVVFHLYSENNLWYHTEAPKSPVIATMGISPQINSMSNAAQYELWHQGLLHPGTNIIQNIHKHVHGIPKLRGNNFWKCASCMSGKCEKSYHMQTKQNPATGTQLRHIQSTDHQDKDDIYMPLALAGQHFHFDFGVMRTKHYREEDNDGRTQTSIDGKNAYLLVIERKTRYMWVYVSASKEPVDIY